MNEVIFKAYDIRGKYPEQIDEAAVAKIAGALGKFWGKGKIIIGHDARLSSPSLYKTFLKTLVASGYTLNPIPVGMITTPMLYFLVNHFKAAGGIMITASHNPKEDNGVKAVGPKAVPIGGKEILGLITNDQ